MDAERDIGYRLRGQRRAVSREHRRPLAAFVVIALACGLFMGYSWRAQAQDLLDVIRGGTAAGQQVIAARPTLQAPLGRHDAGGTTEPDSAGEGAGPVVPDRLAAAARKVTAKVERRKARKATPAAVSKVRSRDRNHGQDSKHRNPKARAASKRVATPVRARRTVQRHVRDHVRRTTREARSHRGHGYGHDRSRYAKRDRSERSHRGHGYGRHGRR